jgi:type 1 glutamine amidotransferase
MVTMTLSGKRILILLGGQWHDFDGFAAAMQSLLQPHGVEVQATYDLDRLLHLKTDPYDVVLSYTCLSPRREGNNPTGPERLSDDQIGGLTSWVRAGGALLAAHAATVIGESDPALGALIGGVFVSHPPQFAFTVYPMFGEHPITAGIEAFTVHDEFYMQTHMPDVQVHMVACDRGIAYPMVWSRTEGGGRVAHIAPGHSQEVWDLKPYQRLLLQTIDWLTQRN